MSVIDTTSSDELLAAAAQAGQAAAIGQLVGRFERRLLRFLAHRCSNRADAEDALQETFAKAFRNLDRYDSRWRFSTWIFTIAIRELRSLQRRMRPWASLDDAAPAATMAEPRAHIGPTWETARRVLGDEQFLAMWLYYGEEMATRDIARVMDRTRVWVKVTLMRARRTLAAELSAEGSQPALAGNEGGAS